MCPQQQAHYAPILERRTIAHMTAQPISRRTKSLVIERNSVEGHPVDTPPADGRRPPAMPVLLESRLCASSLPNNVDSVSIADKVNTVNFIEGIAR